MTLYSIIGLFMRCISNTSMSDWKRQFPDIDYQLLIDFFKQNFEPQEIIKNAWTFLFTIGHGWLTLDEIVLEKSKEGKLRIVKRRYKSAGGYVTPALSIVLLLWLNGSIRIPIRFRVSYPENGNHIDMALNLLSWARNTEKIKPLYVIFDAGFAYERMFKRINDYGWCFVCKISKTRVFNGKQLWRYKKQGFWNDAGLLNCA